LKPEYRQLIELVYYQGYTLRKTQPCCPVLVPFGWEKKTLLFWSHSFIFIQFSVNDCGMQLYDSLREN